MAILGFELEEIAQLLSLLEANGLGELIVEEEDRYLRIRGPRPAKPTSGRRAGTPAPEAGTPLRRLPKPKAIAPPKADSDRELPANQVALVSPMVGMFYQSDKPGAPPFLRVGDPVSVGQTIGLIEAMKIFSEIPAEHAGIVVALPAKDGQLVQAGTPLVILKKE